MNDQGQLIEQVLGQVQPIGEDHPVAQETYDSVKAMLEARAAGELIEGTTEFLSAAVDSAVVIRPGDTVLFSTRDRQPDDIIVDLKRRLEAELPEINAVILDGITVTGIYRREEP